MSTTNNLLIETLEMAADHRHDLLSVKRFDELGWEIVKVIVPPHDSWHNFDFRFRAESELPVPVTIILPGLLRYLCDKVGYTLFDGFGSDEYGNIKYECIARRSANLMDSIRGELAGEQMQTTVSAAHAVFTRVKEEKK